jgi:UDP-N-acetylglucosamine 4,6-dehydratase/5-epimerase
MKLLMLALFFYTITAYCHLPTNEDLFMDKTIVITGGSGFLGRGLIKALLQCAPREIRVFSRDEVKHALLHAEFADHPNVTSVIGDIRDYDALLSVTKDTDVLIHAAALKRIDMMESHVQECIKTNIMGTLNVFNACVSNEVPKVIFISTDKAASPVNVYGACKFVSEKIFSNYAHSGIKTQFTTVRYGNVMSSTGSVIPLFLQKIKNGEPIVLTDPRMTRFAISLEEAVGLIFDALRYGVGGEVFVKQLPSFRISNLIQVLKKHHHSEVPVVIKGIRPGEKIHEILVNQSEIVRTIAFKDLYIVVPTLERLFDQDQEPIYVREGTLVDWDLSEEYSSENTLLDLGEIEFLLNRHNLLD